MNERCRGGIEGPTRPDQTERAQRECGWNGLAPVYLREELPSRCTRPEAALFMNRTATITSDYAH